MPNENANISVDVMKTHKKSPRKYNTAPNRPTDRIENFRNSALANKPEKLCALKY